MSDFTFSQLTPTAFLDRSARVFPERVAIVDGELRFSYAELSARSYALTGALAGLGVEPGDRVAALCANSHVMLELHHGVPLRGAVLVPLNIRLSVPELTYIVTHSGAKVLVATVEFAEVGRSVAQATGVRLIVAGAGAGAGADGAGDEYEALLASAGPDPVPCRDERGLLAINYTSGTTGRPKGVMYHHRGAYLQALAMAFHTRLAVDSRYLWTLPMFHCNGWCFTWAVGAAGATHVCLRAVAPSRIWALLREQGITHYAGAPTVLSMIANAPEAGGAALDRPVQVMTGGAPPSPTLLASMAALRMVVTHLYGLTETYGPVGLNDWQPQWNDHPLPEQATMKARQGVTNIVGDRLRVVDERGLDVPADGAAIGEIVARGNNVMLGYYLDDDATEQATIDGWMRTGDLAVMHPDGYLEIRDRAKDVIISGGENIASIEVEQAIVTHPQVLEAAVVAQSHEVWGQVPVAYVALQPGAEVSEADIREHVRERLAHFKAPHRVWFTELPKTSTGKIRKNELRRQAEKSE
jgi:fatty-acyl-CoA synthase